MTRVLPFGDIGSTSLVVRFVGPGWIGLENTAAQQAVEIRVELGEGAEEAEHLFGVGLEVPFEAFQQRPGTEEELLEFAERERLG